MSTITVTNIKATGETASRSATGVAAAWVLYDQESTGTATLNNSLNLSSITDGGTGSATINYTNAFSSIEYSPTTGCGTQLGLSNNVGMSLSPNRPDFTASSTFVNTRRRDTNANVDVRQATLNVCGDLA